MSEGVFERANTDLAAGCAKAGTSGLRYGLATRDGFVFIGSQKNEMTELKGDLKY